MIPTLNKNYIVSTFKLPGTITLVFLNGGYQPELSDENANLILDNKDNQDNQNKQVKQILTLPKNTNIGQPIHLLFLATQNCSSFFEIVAESGSYTTIIEEYVSGGNEVYTNNIVINISAKPDSSITFYKLQTGDISRANYQIKTNIAQEQNSKITTILISKGAKTALDLLHINLLGKGAGYTIKGIDLLSTTQNIGHKILIEHFVENCTSDVLFKAVVTDQATSDFDCRVVVHPGAIKTATHVTNKNLLLSELATVNTAPELEIYADDVICTHGATVGQLDQDAIFYLRSRGIEKSSAIKLLTAAFVQEITTQFVNYDRLKTAMELPYEL